MLKPLTAPLVEACQQSTAIRYSLILVYITRPNLSGISTPLAARSALATASTAPSSFLKVNDPSWKGVYNPRLWLVDLAYITRPNPDPSGVNPIRLAGEPVF